MDMLDLVRQYWPNVSDELADELLWSLTPFPCAGIDQIKNSLQEYLQRSSGDPQVALDLADNDMQRALDQMHLKMYGERNNIGVIEKDGEGTN